MTLAQGPQTAPDGNGSVPSEADILIESILAITKSHGSKNFYRKAIAQLGPLAVEQELSELKYALKNREIKSPARYFTKLLVERLKGLEKNGKVETSAIPPKEVKLLTHFSPTQLTLFKELQSREIKEDEKGEDKTVPVHHSKNTLIWATFVGPQFFTLSTNKAKSDTITAEFHTIDDKNIAVEMIRGRLFPGGKEYGIPTAEHGRVLGALVDLWVEQGAKYSEYADGAVSCYCYVQVRNLAGLLGWNKFGGSSMNHLINMISDLKAMPYYLALDKVEELKLAGYEGIGFTFLGDVTLLSKKEQKRQERVIRISFSSSYSRQLVLRRTVTRSKEMLTHSRELTFLVRLYLEPILLGANGGSYSGIELQHLIEELHLPAADWHKTGWRRKQTFQRVVDELKGVAAYNGRRFMLEIQEGLRDYVLMAWLLPAGVEDDIRRVN